MLEIAQAHLETAARNVGLNDGELNEIKEPQNFLSSEIEISGQKYPVFRVQHSDWRGPYSGGIRLHPDIDEDEVQFLATLMSIKTAAVNIPMGGGRGGIGIDCSRLSVDELEELAREYVRRFVDHIGPNKDIVGPDINADSNLLDWMADEYERLTGDKSKAAFVGKSLSSKGSEGQKTAISLGALYALKKFTELKNLTMHTQTVAVLGFEETAVNFAKAIEVDTAFNLVGASDSKGAIFSRNDRVKVQDLLEAKTSTGTIKSYQSSETEALDVRDFVAQDVDILVLASGEASLNVNNFESVKAKVVVEISDGSIDVYAHDALASRGVFILPDIIANAGEAVVGYYEWLQNKHEEHWDEATVNSRLMMRMNEAVEEVYSRSIQYHQTMKEAAYSVALERLIA